MTSLSVFNKNGKITIMANGMINSENIIHCGKNIIVLHMPVSDLVRTNILQFAKECPNCDICNLMSKLLHKFGPDKDTECTLTIIGCIGNIIYINQFDVKKNLMKILYCGNAPAKISV